MKALRLEAYRRLRVVDTPIPVPQRGEVLLRVRACGICGSDVHGYDGSTGRRRPPLVMGHEAAGEVAELGDAVSGWNVGDRVTLDSTVHCGDCWHCRRGETNLCDRRQVLGVACADYRRDGAFAEFVVAPQRILHRLPEGLAFEAAAVTEAVAVAAHAVTRAHLEPGSTVVVVGAGMIGLLVIQILQAAGHRRIVALDPAAPRRQLATRLGAAHTLGPDEGPPADWVRTYTGGRGADAAFEVVGRGRTLATAVECVRKGGTVALVGNLDPTAELPLQAVVTRELSLVGSCASAGEYPACLAMIADGRVDVQAILSATAPLDEGPAWFERLHAGEPGLLKVILRP